MKPARRGPSLLSVVIPVRNEEALVDQLVRRAVAACHKAGVEGFELILVNDGSDDATLPLLVALSQSVPQLRVIDLSRRFGHMAALSAGLVAAGGDAVVVMDGDLQDPPELIPELIAAWRHGFDVAYGLRTGRSGGILVRWLSRGFHRLMRILVNHPMPVDAGTFGLMDRKVAEVVAALPERSRFFAGLRAWYGGRQRAVPYTRSERAAGRSRVGLAGLLQLAEGALVSFSKAPLRLASLISLACSFFMLAYGTYAVLVRLFTNLAIPGWATSTVLIGLMGFVQSLVLAVISSYVGVIFDEVKRRPLYVVSAEYRAGQRRPASAAVTRAG